ncbi:hypothetical protein FACS189451_05930 [Bacteroidia bacterium]|nr:hypothetical protein FACS189451_05930 [Bacteroidia bacterium]
MPKKLKVVIINEKLQLNQVESILFKAEKVEVIPEALTHVKAGFDFLKKFSDEKLIYGINTGFGPMAQYRVSDEFREQLQYNLIRSHSTGTGALLPPLYVKSVMLARLSTFLQGHPHPQYNKYQNPDNFKSFYIDHGNIVWGDDWDLMFPIEQLYKGKITQ